jgi:hypothetical protein
LFADNPAARSVSSGTAAAGQLLEDDRPNEHAEVPVRVTRPVLQRPRQHDKIGEHGISGGDLTDRTGERDTAHNATLRPGWKLPGRALAGDRPQVALASAAPANGQSGSK